MLMVIFGAGASYDVRFRPSIQQPTDAIIPLAAQLFDPAYGRFAVHYPACQPLLKRLRAAGSNVELELEAIRSETADQPFLARQLEAVRYYLAELIADAEDRCLRALPDQVTNYIDVLEEIEHWRVRSRERERIVLVTFNYDSLIDRACRAVLGLRLRSLEDFVHEGDYVLLKLHGSIDWSEEVDPPGKALTGSAQDQANQLIDLVGRYQRTGRYAMSGYEVSGWGPLRPALAVPMATKTGDAFACPREHIQALYDLIPHVSQLVVVGWRGAEGHFHDRWRRATSTKTLLQKALVVDHGDDAAAQVKETLVREMSIGGGVGWHMEAHGFTAFVDSSALKDFLETS